jgi:hypothetical protein
MTTIHDIPPELAPHWFRNTAEFWLARHGEREPNHIVDANKMVEAADLAEAKRRLADEGDKAELFHKAH